MTRINYCQFHADIKRCEWHEESETCTIEAEILQHDGRSILVEFIGNRAVRDRIQKMEDWDRVYLDGSLMAESGKIKVYLEE